MRVLITGSRGLVGRSLARALSDAGVVLWMSGPGQRARFEVTCAADEPAQAFDLGPAHIVHDGAIAGEQLDSLGQALREHVQRDVQRDDVCSALAGWRRMASASNAFSCRPVAGDGSRRKRGSGPSGCWPRVEKYSGDAYSTIDCAASTSRPSRPEGTRPRAYFTIRSK